MKAIKGFYKKKRIAAIFIEGTDIIQMYQFNDNPGVWFFPLIENGRNVERDKFAFEMENDQLTLF